MIDTQPDFKPIHPRKYVAKALMVKTWFRGSSVICRRIYFAVALLHLVETGELPSLDEPPFPCTLERI